MVKADGSVLGALRRRLLQAAELDVAAVHLVVEGVDEDGVTGVDWSTGKGDDTPAHPARGGAARRRPRARAPTRACEGRRRGAPAGAARRPPATLGDGLTAGPPRVPDRHRPGRPAVPRRRGASVAVEIKRRGEIDGVEQLTRYLELLNRDPLLRPVRGIFAAQEIKPQARVLATDRGIRCVDVDYDALRGQRPSRARLSERKERNGLPFLARLA